MLQIKHAVLSRQYTNCLDLSPLSVSWERRFNYWLIHSLAWVFFFSLKPLNWGVILKENCSSISTLGQTFNLTFGGQAESKRVHDLVCYWTASIETSSAYHSLPWVWIMASSDLWLHSKTVFLSGRNPAQAVGCWREHIPLFLVKEDGDKDRIVMWRVWRGTFVWDAESPSEIGWPLDKDPLLSLFIYLFIFFHCSFLWWVWVGERRDDDGFGKTVCWAHLEAIGHSLREQWLPLPPPFTHIMCLCIAKNEPDTQHYKSMTQAGFPSNLLMFMLIIQIRNLYSETPENFLMGM